MSINNTSLLTIDELASASGVSKRTIRFYVQENLLDPPFGETRNARYGSLHLEQLRTIKRLQQEGFTLQRLKAMREITPQAKPKVKMGEPQVFTHMAVAKGIELVVSASLSGLSEAEIRSLAQKTAQALQEALKERQKAHERP